MQWFLQSGGSTAAILCSFIPYIFSYEMFFVFQMFSLLSATVICQHCSIATSQRSNLATCKGWCGPCGGLGCCQMTAGCQGCHPNTQAVWVILSLCSEMRMMLLVWGGRLNIKYQLKLLHADSHKQRHHYSAEWFSIQYTILTMYRNVLAEQKCPQCLSLRTSLGLNGQHACVCVCPSGPDGEWQHHTGLDVQILSH